MIFATVGTQMPFDRLLSALDSWAGLHAHVPVQAQTGQSGASYCNLSCVPFMAPDVFRKAMEEARVIVAHAGMGTILTASELGKPVVIMPRSAALGEHRNDHQSDTATEMARLPNVIVAREGEDIAEALNRLVCGRHTMELSGVSPFASAQLLGAVSDFIHGAG